MTEDKSNNTTDKKERDLDERDLVERMKQGDELAFELIIDMYSRKVYGMTYHFLGNHADAEDVSQQVFIKVFRKIKTFKGKSSFKTWLHRVTANCCKDALKSRYRSKMYYMEDMKTDDNLNVQDVIPSDQPTPGENAQHNELVNMINIAMNELSFEHREIIILREKEGMTYEAIAKLLDVNLGTVMSRLHNARKNLSKIFEKKYGL